MTPPYKRKHGGLLRCCLLSLDEDMCDPVKNPPREGDVLTCKYGQDKSHPQMIFRDGSWQWNRPEAQ